MLPRHLVACLSGFCMDWNARRVLDRWLAGVPCSARSREVQTTYFGLRGLAQGRRGFLIGRLQARPGHERPYSSNLNR